MLGSTVLEVAVGLILLFFILSLFATALREAIEGFMQRRASDLHRGLREMLRDDEQPGLVSRIYNHPLVNSLYPGTYDPNGLRNLPAYIPARNFALALLDLSARGDAQAATSTAGIALDQVREGLDRNISNPSTRRAILIALDSAKGDLEQARVNLEAWYDSAMDRVSGWYRKRTQWILFALGLLMAGLGNIDTIKIAQALYQDDAMRSVIVAEAEALVQRAEGADGAVAAPTLERALGCPATLSERVSCAQERVNSLGYPMGWGDSAGREPFGITSVPGWLLTALAIMLGAPFWFDVLNKVMVIRSTVKPHEKSPEEASEDRQLKPWRGPNNAGGSGGGAAAAGGGAGSPGGGAGAQAGLARAAEPEPDADAPEEAVDQCLSTIDLAEDEETSDEELPVAIGGVEDQNRQGM